jgi:hypothetical protein
VLAGKDVADVHRLCLDRIEDDRLRPGSPGQVGFIEGLGGELSDLRDFDAVPDRRHRGAEALGTGQKVGARVQPVAVRDVQVVSHCP